MTKSKILTFIIAASIGISATSHAEVLIIDRVENSAQVNKPKRGSTMNQVRNQFGEPNRVVSAVGEPPITQWVYGEYTVYFEHKHVINTVLHQTNAQENGPKPLN